MTENPHPQIKIPRNHIWNAFYLPVGKAFTDLNSLMKEMECPENDFYKEKEISEGDTEELDPCPIIPVSQEEFEEWCAPWRKSLVINVLGRKISYKMLDNKVQREWAKMGAMSLVDLNQDFYLAQFASEDDYKHALFESPWLIADHYIYSGRYTKQTRKIAAWIRIPGLPIELFNDRFLWRVGSKLGTMLKIDKLTSIQTRGKFARIDFPSIDCIYVLREANQVVDGFAKLGLSILGGMLCFDSLPSWSHFSLVADDSAVLFPRGF
uniref:DUF4283 domain-containing protein n=1 Tax=Cajanus cajan TaxID=3821 RepID=A0A151U007_CAJCA|nr:hypothetical protein KK1_005184 [Cajanus cajan]